MKSGALTKMKLSLHIQTFHALSIKTILVKLPLTPLHMRLGVAKTEF